MTKKDPVAAPAHRGAQLALFAIVVIAAVGRLATLGRESLWLDEAYTFDAISHGVRTLLDVVARTDHPPGYFLMLAGLSSFLGTSEWALRLPSALAGIACVALVGGWAMRKISTRAGLIAAVLECVSVMQLGDSQEARPYIFVHLLSILSFCLLYSFLNRPRIWTLFLYGLSGIALIYAHYFGIYVLFAEFAGVCVLAVGRRLARPRRLVALVCLAQALILSSYAWWLPTFLARLGLHRRGYKEHTGLTAIGQVISTLFNSSATLVAILLAAGAAVLWHRLRGARTRLFAAEPRDVWLLALTSCVVTVLAPLVTSLALTPVYVPRYLIVALFPLHLVMAMWFAGPGRWRWLLVAAIPGLFPIWLYYAGVHKEPWRELTRTLVAHRKEGEPVYVWPRASASPIEYYAPAIGPLEAYDPGKVPCDETYWVASRRALDDVQEGRPEAHEFHADGNRTLPSGQSVSLLLRYPDSPGGTPISLVHMRRSPACAAVEVQHDDADSSRAPVARPGDK